MDSEGDIWDYVSLKRLKANEKTPVSCRKRGRLISPTSSSPQSSTSSPANKVRKKVKKTSSRRQQSQRQGKKEAPTTISIALSGKKPTEQTREVFDGHCPNCQMPFNILHIKSPKWHVADCMVSLSSNKECPDGLECNSTIPSHYRKCSHNVLAAQRAGQDVSVIHAAGEASKDVSDIHCDSQTVQNFSVSPVDVYADGDFSDVPSHRGVCNDISDAPTQSCALEQDEDDDTLASDMSSQSKYQTDKPCQTGTESKSTRRLFFKRVIRENVSRNPDLKWDDNVESDEDIFSPLEIWPKSDVECVKPQTISDDQFCLEDSNRSLTIQTPASDFEGLTHTVRIPQHVEKFMNNEVRNEMCNSIETDCTEIEATIDDVISVCSELDQDFESSSDATDETLSVSKSQERVQERMNDIVSHQEDTLDYTDSFPSSIRQDIAKTQSSITAFFRPLNNVNKSTKRIDVKKQLSCETAGSAQTTAIKNNSYPRWTTKSDTQAGSSQTTAIKNNSYSRWTTKSDTQTSTSNNQGNKEKYSGRKCPFYKKIPYTPFTVDAFRYGVIPDCQAYFLSHFHYDHYMGLNKHFQQPLYCSKVTGNLVKAKIKVAAKHIHSLPMNEICVVMGIEVMLLEANHCPGAVMILFKLPNGRTYLHTGDFRADASMEAYTVLKENPIDSLYLDTTYCNPTYTFPPQADVIAFAVSIAVNTVAANCKTLVVCGSYTIGKERIFVALANALGCKVCVTREKKSVLDCVQDKEMDRLLTLNGDIAQLHVVSMSYLNLKGLSGYLHKFRHLYDSVLAFKPTGWTHNERVSTLSDIKPVKRGVISIYGVPYSEHSSYSEMKRFVQFLKPHKIIPTVNNGSAQARKNMEQHFTQWLKEK
ncbi:DNA cross-link repair 1A protein-like [Glandiceps talaboti]